MTLSTEFAVHFGVSHDVAIVPFIMASSTTTAVAVLIKIHIEEGQWMETFIREPIYVIVNYNHISVLLGTSSNVLAKNIQGKR